MSETKTYLTTDKAGPRVAGRVVPRDANGKPTSGVEFALSDVEAAYDLRLGAIVLKTEAPTNEASAKPEKPKAPVKSGVENTGS
jgi:hypothetical protein